MKTFKKTLLTSLAVLFIVVSAFATGQNDDVREFTIKGTDNMKFDVSLIEASPGETIRITLETVSNMPPQAMAHNIAVVDLDVDVDAFVMASMSARDTEYIAPEYADKVIAHTKMISGGETSVIEFTMPDTPGDYEFVCTFPGHYYGGMKGIIRVN
ncbi:MAG: plastocyanin/azurin family copper-binding protein [Balneolaceae bacterium]